MWGVGGGGYVSREAILCVGMGSSCQEGPTSVVSFLAVAWLCVCAGPFPGSTGILTIIGHTCLYFVLDGAKVEVFGELLRLGDPPSGDVPPNPGQLLHLWGNTPQSWTCTSKCEELLLNTRRAHAVWQQPTPKLAHTCLLHVYIFQQLRMSF